MNEMKVCFRLLLLCAFCSCSKREASQVNPADFQVVYTLSQIPKTALDGAVALWPASFPGITDPSHAFQATDMFTTNVLPFRRLIFAAVSQKQVVVAYERGGGPGLYRCFIAFAVDGDEAKPSVAGFLPAGAKAPQQALKVIADGRFEKIPTGVGDPRL